MINGSVVISQQEIIDIDLSCFPSLNTGEQAVLSLLKEKGAPIEGILLLKFTSGYKITEEHCPFSLHTKYTWHKV